jgi:hypothetical protein
MALVVYSESNEELDMAEEDIGMIFLWPYYALSCSLSSYSWFECARQVSNWSRGGVVEVEDEQNN